MLLNPIFFPLVQSQTTFEQTLLSSSTSSLSKRQFPPSLLTVASDVANLFANQLNSVTNNSTTTSSSSSKSQISSCHLCGKKFQTNDYLQLHLMNKHQITTDIQDYDSQQQRTKMTN
jgi:GTP:adenosylcobinamide-phosphate guanylyltransferase